MDQPLPPYSTTAVESPTPANVLTLCVSLRKDNSLSLHLVNSLKAKGWNPYLKDGSAKKTSSALEIQIERSLLSNVVSSGGVSSTHTETSLDRKEIKGDLSDIRKREKISALLFELFLSEDRLPNQDSITLSSANLEATVKVNSLKHCLLTFISPENHEALLGNHRSKKEVVDEARMRLDNILGYLDNVGCIWSKAGRVISPKERYPDLDQVPEYVVEGLVDESLFLSENSALCSSDHSPCSTPSPLPPSAVSFSEHLAGFSVTAKLEPEIASRQQEFIDQDLRKAGKAPKVWGGLRKF